MKQYKNVYYNQKSNYSLVTVKDVSNQIVRFLRLYIFFVMYLFTQMEWISAHAGY